LPNPFAESAKSKIRSLIFSSTEVVEKILV